VGFENQFVLAEKYKGSASALDDRTDTSSQVQLSVQRLTVQVRKSAQALEEGGDAGLMSTLWGQ
jgi:hypothetical protein